MYVPTYLNLPSLNAGRYLLTYLHTYRSKYLNLTVTGLKMIGKSESEALSSTTQGNLHSVREELSALNGTWNNEQIDIRVLIIIIISFVTFPLRFRKIQNTNLSHLNSKRFIYCTYLCTYLAANNDITTSV